MDYLQQLHPNMINYQLQTVLYQVVTGMNFQMLYNGLDSITQINATVSVGLDGVAMEDEFTVLCMDNASLDCNSDLANELYLGN